MRCNMTNNSIEWKKVQLARSKDRPTSRVMIDSLFDQFTELHGDRYFGDDPAIIGGIAKLDDQPVTVIGVMKGNSIESNLSTNFGMVHPEGYRKALRLMKQAEKFRRPIITFIDTPGAYPGIGAEERGQAEAIARNLFEMSRLTVPVIAIILGEAASGGAIGLAVANQVWMLENSIYCILSPEGFASILYKDSTKAPDIVEQMKITADALLELGIVDAVIEEGENGLPQNLVSVCYQLRMKLSSTLKSYKKMKPKAIQKERMERFRKFGDVDYEK